MVVCFLSEREESTPLFLICRRHRISCVLPEDTMRFISDDRDKYIVDMRLRGLCCAYYS